MQQYQLHFGHREPYQVLLDSAIIRDAARFKIRLGHMLQQTLHGDIKPLISQCCIRHLYNYKPTTDEEKRAKDEWISVAKQAERRRCGHHELEEPLEEKECVLSMVDPKGSGTNKHRYVVATQDQPLRSKLRQVAGVPLVYINRSVMILEPMAATTERVREADEKGKIKAGLKGARPGSGGVKRKREDEEEEEAEAPDRAKLIRAMESAGGGRVENAYSRDERAERRDNSSTATAAPKKRKAKGPKGPNPLSMKKPKAEKQQKKTVSREVEDERSAIRKANRLDPQAAEKAMSAGVAVSEGNRAVDGAGSEAEGGRKRKRKRKGKEEGGVGLENVQNGVAVDVEGGG